MRGVSARLEAMAAARRAELEGAAAVLAGAPTLDERDVMDPQVRTTGNNVQAASVVLLLHGSCLGLCCL